MHRATMRTRTVRKRKNTTILKTTMPAVESIKLLRDEKIRKGLSLTRVEEAFLIFLCQKSLPKTREFARNVLLEANTPYVRTVARELYEYDQYAYSIQDLVQDGLIGVLKAVDRFDLTRGKRFWTYAEWQVLSAIQRNRPHKYGFKIPEDVVLNFGKRIATSDKKPTAAELSQGTKYSEELAQAYLDLPLRAQNHDLILSNLRAQNSNPDRMLARDEMENFANSILANLPSLDRTMLEFSLGKRTKWEGLSNGKIGKLFGISRETVRLRLIKLTNELQETVKMKDKKYLSHAAE